MEIDQIRNAFSKGLVAVTDHGIVILYNFKDRWVTQLFSEETRDVFLEFLEDSDRLLVACSPGNAVKFIFCKGLTGQETIFYAPISEKMTTQELDEIMNSLADEKKEEEFLANFANVDMSDEGAILEKLREIVEKDREKHKTNIVSLPAMNRWRQVKKLATEFANIFCFRYELLEPDYGYDGSVTVFFPEKMNKAIIITGKIKKLFEEAIKAGTEFEIECNVNEGFVNFIFYA